MKRRLYSNQIWDPSISRLVDGEIERFDGRAVHLMELIQRRWGWPHTSAKSAAEFMRSQSRAQNQQAGIQVDALEDKTGSQAKRLAQQAQLFHDLPTLLGDICNGLVGRVISDIDNHDNEVTEVVIVFDSPTPEHGMIRDIVRALSSRLDIASEELESVLDVHRDGGLVSVRVKNGEHT